jgi:hypothetical protein
MEKPNKPKRKQPNIGWFPTPGGSSEEARRARVRPAGSEGPAPRQFPAPIQSAVDGASSVGEAVGNLAKEVGLQTAADVAIDVTVAVAIDGPKKAIENITDIFS